MKHHLLLFIMVFLFPFMACGDDELKEIYNPNLLRSTSIDDSSLHLAFPAIAGNKDRSKIIVVYREGSSHVSFDSKLIQMESFDKGKTWVNRKVIFAPVKGHDVRDPQLLVLPNNGILCRLFERESETESIVKSICSENWGIFYGSPVLFPFPKDETFAAARGNMVIIDDVIYAVCYNRWAVTWLEKSEDFGRSWEVVSWLDERLWTNQIECGRINEASLGYYDGKMYVVGRQQSENGDNRLEIGVSEDLGVTWTWSFLPIEGHAPSLTPYKDAFILTYRNVKDSNRGKYSFDTVLLKDGKLASNPASLFESDNFDVGYGDVLTLPNSFLVCCYQPGSIRCYELKYDVFNYK